MSWTNNDEHGRSHHTKRPRRRWSRILAIALAGGATLGVHGDPSGAAEASTPDRPALIAESASAGILSSATRTHHVTPGAPLPPPPEPTAAQVAAAAAAVRLVIPSIGMDRPIHRGGQAVIDQGVATWFDDGPGGWPEPSAPGVDGTLWLAGHRTSAGGPFRRVVDIVPGALVAVTQANGRVVTYRVYGSEIHSGADPLRFFDALFGADRPDRHLAIQTSLPSDRRLVVFGEQI